MKIEGYDHYLTIGQLKAFIEKYNLPDDSKILIQRVEDRYFESGWKTIDKKGYWYHQGEESNKKIDEGVFDDKEQYPLLTTEDIQNMRMSQEQLDQCKEQYIVVWSPVKYEDDNNLYLDAHY